MSPTTHTSYRISPEGRELLAKLAAHFGVSRTAMLELLIREKARKALPKGAK